ncbi:MAG: ribosome biogenesis GTPase Der [Dehalococcoidia bacterium]|nr:ribosome biogenesis GTPase Der [Dehalococcoidia bacterium]
MTESFEQEAASAVEAAVASRKATRCVIALVGRPNVGKSTLFNRLVGRREAIVEDIPGTTRDRIYADFVWNGVPLTVVDMGGLDPDGEDAITRGIQVQAREGIEDADVVLFLVDARSGPTPADADVADVLRRSGKPVLLVANKADNQAREQTATEFYTLGLDELFTISAHHGIGVRDLMDRVAEVAPPETEGQAAVRGIPVAIVGRPNVGKSSLVNAILGEERVLVSPIPGTTRDAIDSSFDFEGTPMTLIDTAGVRRAGKVEQGIEKFSVMRSIRAVQRSQVAILVIDGAEGVTAQDAHVGGYIQEALKGLVIAVNKWDLSKEMELEREKLQMELAGRVKFVPGAPIVFTSAKNRAGIGNLLRAVMQVHLNREIRINTGDLNRLMQRAIYDHPPAAIKGRTLKHFYVTQAATSPPTFVFFVNDDKLIHFSYRRYLENTLRRAYGFEGTTINMQFRSRTEQQA